MKRVSIFYRCPATFKQSLATLLGTESALRDAILETCTGGNQLTGLQPVRSRSLTDNIGGYVDDLEGKFAMTSGGDEGAAGDLWLINN